MATVSSDSSPPLAVSAWAVDEETASKSERYLAKRLAAAGADYKGVAFATFVLAAAIAALAWIATGVLVEHWLVPGGLPRWARWTWLGLGLVALAAAVWRWVVPLVRYRVNLVYAARAIEREFPDLHNDLVNAVLVKPDGEGASQRMVRSLKRRVAKRLSGVAVDEAVIDRTAAVRLAGAVAALVAAACLYELLAPKSFLTTAGRLLAPWTTAAAPSRVKISGLQLHWRIPGEDHGGEESPANALKIDSATATIVRGRQLVVTAGLRGLRKSEQPTLTVRPLHEPGAGQSGGTPWQAVMQHRGAASGAGGIFAAVLPDVSRGLDHSIEFTIAAGDARSEPLKVMAVDAPSLLVREVRYDYPAYTRQVAEVVRWQGDIRAVEGTTVTIFAAGNRPIGSGWIDFDCDGKRDRPLKLSASDPAQGSASFQLLLDEERAGPEHASYRLLFQPRDESSKGAGGLWVGDLQHRIDVVPDVAPEIALEDPLDSPLKVPPDAPVRVRVRAVDPDFGLARVGIEVRLKDGLQRQEIALLAKEKSGPFTGTTLLIPRQFGGTPGATLEYRGVAVDTRPEQPNVSRTQWQALIVDASAPAREPERDPRDKPAPQQPEQKPSGKTDGNGQGQGQNQQGQNQQGQNQQGQNQQGQNQQGQNQQGQNQQGQNQQGQNQQGQNQQGQNQQGQNQQGDNQGSGRERDGGRRSPAKDTVAADGTNDGEAMERILEHRRQQEGGQPAEPPGQQQQPGQPGQAGDQSGGEKSGGEKSGGEKSGGEKSGGEKSGGEKSGGEKSGGEKSGGEKSGGEKSGGEKSGGEKSGGEKSGGEKSGGEKSGGEKSGGEKSGGEKSGGEKSGGEKSGGEKSGGEKSEAGEGGNKSGSPDGDSPAGTSQGEGNPSTDRPALDGDQERRELEWDDENFRHARNAADLAVEHLRDALDAGRDDVLDALGWTPEQARAFIDRWQALRRLAEDGDPGRRGEFERAVRSLGLRPGGVRSSRDVPTDVKGGQSEGRRSRPPSDYREQVRAYLQGTSGE